MVPSLCGSNSFATKRLQGTHDNPEIAALPLSVRQLINLTDDPNLPTITFRYFVLSIIFGHKVTGIVTGYLNKEDGVWCLRCAEVTHLRQKGWKIGLPGTRFSFSLNPAPWSIKEHVLVTLTAASGAKTLAIK
jgi:hypothetical protein